MIILTKFHNDWAKIVDFLLKAHFSMCPIFFAPDFTMRKFHWYTLRHFCNLHVQKTVFFVDKMNTYIIIFLILGLLLALKNQSNKNKITFTMTIEGTKCESVTQIRTMEPVLCTFFQHSYFVHTNVL